MCLCEAIYIYVQEPLKAGRECQIPWSWSCSYELFSEGAGTKLRSSAIAIQLLTTEQPLPWLYQLPDYWISGNYIDQ